MSVEAANDTPLLWVIREQLQMTARNSVAVPASVALQFVHVNGEAVRSCQTSVSDAVGKKITTIEGSAPRAIILAEGMDRRAGSAMRLPPVRTDHAGGLRCSPRIPIPPRMKWLPIWTANNCRCMSLFADPEGDHARRDRNADLRPGRRHRAEGNRIPTAREVTPGEVADLSRRSLLVGSAAGLALGYSAVPGLLGADQALAAASNFDPSVWYSRSRPTASSR